MNIISGKTVYLPVELLKKYGAEPIGIIGMFFYEDEEPSNSQWKRLEKLGLSEKFSFKEDAIVKFLKEKSPQTYLSNSSIRDYIFLKICDWCNSESALLHEHHYPVSRKNGGKNIVEICPSCHCEFHHLTDRIRYRICPEIIEIFEKCHEYMEKQMEKEGYSCVSDILERIPDPEIVDFLG